VAAALRPPEPGDRAVDWVAAVEEALARRGPPSAGRLRRGLRRLEWGVRLRTGRPFYWMPREERAAWIARRAHRHPAEHAFWVELLDEAADGRGACAAAGHSGGE